MIPTTPEAVASAATTDDALVRWNAPIPEDEALASGLPIHARLTCRDYHTLCERAGDPPVVAVNSIVLNLDSRGGPDFTHTVTCPGCVEMMHA